MTKHKRSPAEEFESMDDDEGRGQVFDLKGIAQIFGMTRYAVKECIARGAPVIHRPRSKLEQWEIAAGEFLQWLVRDELAHNETAAGQYHAAKTQKTVAEIEKLEMANRAIRTSHVTIAEAAMAARENNDVVRRHLGAVPADVVRKLAALSPKDRRDASMVERVISDCVNDAMTAISNTV
jgi:phage terminase Nu1 subunit (DNA packaging protein)